MSPRPSRRARVLLLLAAAVPLLVAGGWHLAVWIALRSPLGVSPASVAAAIPRATRLYTRDGDLLYEFAEERRTWVPLDQVSPRLVEAVLAVEDEHFREHSGIRWSAMVRAMVANLRAGGFVQGGSTITQQVARNLFLTREKSLWRKLSEMILARRLEAELTKDEILEIYLNMVYWGEGAWGVEEAARTFFCASAGTLDEAQSALLAGLIAAPARLSPIAHPERARQRFEHVRRRLGDEGLPYPGIAPCPRHRLELAPHTAVRVRTWLLRTLGEEAFARGDRRCGFTLDARVQQALAEGVRRTLEARGPGSAAWPRFRILHEAPSPPPEGCRVTSGQPLWVLVEGEPDAKGMLPVSWRGRHGVLPLEALALDLAGFEPPRPGEGEVILATPAEELDSCSPWEGDPRIFVPVASPQLAVVAVDASTGEVLGSVGG
ncbi:MAG: transglycosylase domain-containing protein, partial [Deltaproteobacteria bacterium]|nr:transglycosylase domain-containing protein [Deltaproteobacteria bacterium]